MRKLITILTLVSLLVQSTAQFAVLALFRVRKAYIIQNMCENRDRPQLKCCGKCILNKQLKKVTTGAEGEGDNITRYEKEISMYLLPAGISLPPVTACDEAIRWRCSYASLKVSLFVIDVFHPPPIAG